MKPFWKSSSWNCSLIDGARAPIRTQTMKLMSK